MNNKYMRFFNVTLVGLALQACAPRVDHGEVIGKMHEDERHYVYLQPIPHRTCFGFGKNRTCSTRFTYIPIPKVDDEDWYLQIEDCSLKHKEGSSCPQTTVPVSKELFERTEFGDYVDFRPTPAPARK